MRLPHFFIDRPIFAAVLSILIVIIGAIAYPSLPVGQYPEIAPPTVVVSANYPGATAETLAETIAAPLEESINGVENMIYMQSSSTGDGNVSITVTFKAGTNVDQAQVLVQNRVATAEPRLPEEVRQIGVTVRKNSPDLLMVMNLYSPDKSLSQQYVANYATLQVVDRLSRVPGVGGVRIIGGRDYNMRVWIDPDAAASRNLTVDEIIAAIRDQNAQVAAGSVGQPPFNQGGTAFQLGIQTEGRLTTTEQFGEIILKRSDDGRLTRLSDIARIELGAQDYGTNAYRDKYPSIGVAVTQLPGSNALKTAAAVEAEMEALSKAFPPGLIYSIPYHPTEYISASIAAVEETLFEAIVLVALVVLVFLQSWRASIIPIIAIPVSLVGSFAAMAAFGFSLNNLSLFGLVLAIGIVVDDAIVVVENIERLMEEGLAPRAAAHKTMDEVSGALIAIALVLCGVFIPTAFIPGISGAFYKQFALTIVSATAISAFVSLTLSPALAALILKPKSHEETAPPAGWRGLPVGFARGFNNGFERLSVRYGKLTARLVRALGMIGIAYVLLLAIAGWRFYATPTGFIPAQDQSYLIGVVQLPPGASLQRTDEIVQQAAAIARENPAVKTTIAFAGFDGATFTTAPNAGAIFITLKDFDHRTASSDQVANELRKAYGAITAGNVLVVPPPPVRGIGTGGGFKMMIEDRSGAGYAALEGAAFKMKMAANQEPGLNSVFTTFNTKTPRLKADIDRERAEQIGVPVERVFSTLGTYLGSTYVNDFNFLGRTFRVTAGPTRPTATISAISCGSRPAPPLARWCRSLQ
jgi:hydrophobe/amphiphile efflux-1 (HAE1) family protein